LVLPLPASGSQYGDLANIEAAAHELEQKHMLVLNLTARVKDLESVVLEPYPEPLRLDNLQNDIGRAGGGRAIAVLAILAAGLVAAAVWGLVRAWALTMSGGDHGKAPYRQLQPEGRDPEMVELTTGLGSPGRGSNGVTVPNPRSARNHAED